MSKLKASTRLCICDECQKDYGSCKLFKEYDLVVQQLNKQNLRFNFTDPGIDGDNDDDEMNESATNEILLPGTIVALAAEKKSTNTFYLIKVSRKNGAKQYDDADDYGKMITRGHKHLEGHFFEKICGSDRRYKLSKKTSFFYRESVVYAFIQMEETKKGYKLSDEEFIQIMQFLEESGCTGLFKA